MSTASKGHEGGGAQVLRALPARGGGEARVASSSPSKGSALDPGDTRVFVVFKKYLFI